MHAAPGYEPVLELFDRGRWAFGRGGGAFAAYIGGVPVVDAWGGQARPGQPWQENTTTVIMSATKGLASLCVQILVEEGRLVLYAPVTDYWPEFGAAGKEATTLRHVMLHTAGLFGSRTRTRCCGGTARGGTTTTPSPPPSPPRHPAGSRARSTATTPPASAGWWASSCAASRARPSARSSASASASPCGSTPGSAPPDSELDRVAHVCPTDADALPRWLSAAYRSMLAVARDENSLTGKAFLGGNGTSALDEIEGLMNAPAFLWPSSSSPNAPWPCPTS